MNYLCFIVISVIPLTSGYANDAQYNPITLGPNSSATKILCGLIDHHGMTVGMNVTSGSFIVYLQSNDASNCFTPIFTAHLGFNNLTYFNSSEVDNFLYNCSMASTSTSSTSPTTISTTSMTTTPTATKGSSVSTSTQSTTSPTTSLTTTPTTTTGPSVSTSTQSTTTTTSSTTMTTITTIAASTTATTTTSNISKLRLAKSNAPNGSSTSELPTSSSVSTPSSTTTTTSEGNCTNVTLIFKSGGDNNNTGIFFICHGIDMSCDIPQTSTVVTSQTTPAATTTTTENFTNGKVEFFNVTISSEHPFSSQPIEMDVNKGFSVGVNVTQGELGINLTLCSKTYNVINTKQMQSRNYTSANLLAMFNCPNQTNSRAGSKAASNIQSLRISVIGRAAQINSSGIIGYVNGQREVFTDSSSDSPQKSGLAGGAIAGIVIGCIIVVTVISMGVWRFVIKRRRLHWRSQEESNMEYELFTHNTPTND